MTLGANEDEIIYFQPKMLLNNSWAGRLSKFLKVVNWTVDVILFAGTTGGILLCAFVVDLIVWYKAGSISFVEEPAEEEEESANRDELSPMAAETSV